MNVNRHDQPKLAQLRRRRKRPAAWLALLAYLVVGAIVPPGHMAAALASGTAFHLCPGDLRSKQILAVLAGGAAGADAPASARHDSLQASQQGFVSAPPAGPHAGHTDTVAAIEGVGDQARVHHGVVADALDSDAADAGCTLTSGASAAVDALASLPDESRPVAVRLLSFRSLSPVAVRWLRPPVRSPPV